MRMVREEELKRLALSIAVYFLRLTCTLYAKQRVVEHHSALSGAYLQSKE
jgi:hypothetical protein